MNETGPEREARELREVEAMLRNFFAQRDKLEAELKTIDGLIAQFGRGYWRRLGYTMVPRIEKLRIAIMGK